MPCLTESSNSQFSVVDSYDDFSSFTSSYPASPESSPAYTESFFTDYTNPVAPNDYAAQLFSEMEQYNLKYDLESLPSYEQKLDYQIQFPTDEAASPYSSSSSSCSSTPSPLPYASAVSTPAFSPAPSKKSSKSENAVALSEPSYTLAPLLEGQKYVDITDYLNMPQSHAAKIIGVPTSTLSKRWKEAARGKKWPYRTVRKLDKEITTLMQTTRSKKGGHNAAALSADAEATLGFLLRRRSSALQPVVIRV